MVWKASIYLALIGPFRKCFKFKERNKPPVSAPNMEQHMVRDRWVRWALWQLELFVLCHKVLFFFLHATLQEGTPEESCEPHRDALYLTSSPPCGFRQRPNAHLPGFMTVQLSLSLSHLTPLGTMEAIERGRWRGYGIDCGAAHRPGREFWTASSGGDTSWVGLPSRVPLMTAVLQQSLLATRRS